MNRIINKKDMDSFYNDLHKESFNDSRLSYYSLNEGDTISKLLIDRGDPIDTLSFILDSQPIINLHSKKFSKEDMFHYPIPLFDCIYCANEKISFNHFINCLLSQKYSGALPHNPYIIYLLENHLFKLKTLRLINHTKTNTDSTILTSITPALLNKKRRRAKK